jgi:spore germination cell wall hydrolase CwlJ-like protein
LTLSLLLTLTPLSLVSATPSEVECLTRNIYHEAQGEPFQGKVAVALVTLNRVDDPQFPDSICKVVYQKGQFSWTKNYSKVKVNQQQWQDAKDAAAYALLNRDYNFKATHFHNATVKPRWKLKRVAKIANHYFYM